MISTGNTSTYGDMVVNYTSPAGKITQVAVVKGMAVYVPNTQRQITLPLDTNYGIDYRQGKLHIAYTTQSDAKPTLMAETDLALQ
ncbi:MAG: hypothetical protein EOO61_22075 [Hymenobacter sp.]|nr:MAG: hypothetical protein EOO61_22075 [Hymenobacter sp.]